MEPAPIATTTNALAKDESNPRDTTSGAIKLAEVIMATVPDPWAIFNAAAMIMGRKMPRLFAPDRLFLITSPIPDSCNTLPKAPPHPVTMMMVAAAIIPCPSQPEVESISLVSFLGSRKARKTPSKSATVG